MSKPVPKQFELTRACAVSEERLIVSTVDSASDVYEPESLLWRYDRNDGTQSWVKRDISAHIERIVPIHGDEECAVLSAEGEVFYNVFGDISTERMIGAGTFIDGAKGYGRMLSLSQRGDMFHASGNGGQIYVRQGPGEWALLTDQLLYDAAERLNKIAPSPTDPDFLEWLDKAISEGPRDVALHDICALNENAVYVCGVDSGAPILCYWDGAKLHELKVHLDEAALTGIYIENEDSLWVCGREGVLLHGSYARGFTPVNIRRQLNLFHMIVPYRGKLVLPSSVRPGGLFELDPVTSDLRRFSPALPKLRGEYISYAGSVGDVLWVVGDKDIFRFDGSEWERIEHPSI